MEAHRVSLEAPALDAGNEHSAFPHPRLRQVQQGVQFVGASLAEALLHQVQRALGRQHRIAQLVEEIGRAEAVCLAVELAQRPLEQERAGSGIRRIGSHHRSSTVC